MKQFARGYIHSSSFKGNRLPQHIQNQIVKNYCDTNNFTYILSRAEYAITNTSVCQLWAALKENIPNIVMYSLWQLPSNEEERHKAISYALRNNIAIHFACENMVIDSIESVIDIELTFKVKDSIEEHEGEYHSSHINDLRALYF